MRQHLGFLICLGFTLIFCTGLALLPIACKPGTDCTNPKNSLDATCVAQVAVDCAGGDIQGAISQYSPVVQKIITSATNPDGSINWASIEGALVEVALQYGGCVVSDVFGGIISGKASLIASGPGSAGSAGSANSTGSATAKTSTGAKEAYARVKAAAFPGKTFKLANGASL